MTDREIKQIKKNWSSKNLMLLMHVNVSFLDDDKDEALFFKNNNTGTYIDDMNSDRIYNWISSGGMEYHKLFTNNEFIILDMNDLSDTPSVYPLCVLYEHTFEILDEVECIKTFNIVTNTEQLNALLNSLDDDKIDNVKYCSIVNDVYMDFKASYDTIAIEMYNRYNRCTMKTIKFNNADVLITDPCYFLKKEDDDKIMFGHNYKKLGIRNSITHENGWGDCVSGVFVDDKKIGTYSADAGMVCVCCYDDVFNYNPDINTYIENGSAYVIKNFTGTVHFEFDEDRCIEVIGIGIGNINFRCRQISL